MTDLTAIEQEIIEATKFKMKRFANRQDYLAAIARAMEKMPGDDYDNLSDDATDWYEAAAKAVNANDDIPDFPEEDEPDEEADDVEESADDEADDEADEASEDDTEGEEPKDVEEGEVEEEPEPEPKPTKNVKTAKGKKEPEPVAEGPKGTRPEVVAKMKAKKDAKEAKHERKQGTTRNLPKTRYDDITGKKNRYGVVEGTKTDDFCKMIEKGASMGEVKEALGDTYYNTIKRLREAGHSVEKNDAGKFVLKHKDDVGGKKEKAKTKKE